MKLLSYVPHMFLQQQALAAAAATAAAAGQRHNA
jgi:hypothetical protein